MDVLRTDMTPRVIFGMGALRQCPYLEVLQLLIDAVNIDIDPIEAESFQHTSLQKLHVYSDMADPQTVARIISSVLPYVFSKVDYYNAQFSGSQDFFFGTTSTSCCVNLQLLMAVVPVRNFPNSLYK
jgi:hypothetical protein